MPHFCLDDSPRFRMIELEGIDSTNSFLAQYRPPHPTDITLVTAEYQTAGRGQKGNTWESAPGKNLLFSLLVKPNLLPAERVFVVSEAIALSIREAIEATIEEEGGATASSHPCLTVKWPNDIYADEKKIAGILIENTLAGQHIGQCIIGCGVDVNQRQFEGDAPNPVSIGQLTGKEVERRFVLEKIMEGFTRRYTQIQSGHYDAIHQDYLAALYHRTGQHDYMDLTAGEGEPFRASIADVEPDGHLILSDTEEHTRRFAFKEVAFVS